MLFFFWRVARSWVKILAVAVEEIKFKGSLVWKSVLNDYAAKNIFKRSVRTKMRKNEKKNYRIFWFFFNKIMYFVDNGCVFCFEITLLFFKSE